VWIVLVAALHYDRVFAQVDEVDESSPVVVPEHDIRVVVDVHPLNTALSRLNGMAYQAGVDFGRASCGSGYVRATLTKTPRLLPKSWLHEFDGRVGTQMDVFADARFRLNTRQCDFERDVYCTASFCPSCLRDRGTEPMSGSCMYWEALGWKQFNFDVDVAIPEGLSAGIAIEIKDFADPELGSITVDFVRLQEGEWQTLGKK
jgi:hypothetical protein